jgi:hypothetical protein
LRINEPFVSYKELFGEDEKEINAIIEQSLEVILNIFLNNFF